MSFGVLEALPKARRTVGDTVISTGRRGTGGGPWGRPENEGASVTRYGLIFPTFRDAFLRKPSKTEINSLSMSLVVTRTPCPEMLAQEFGLQVRFGIGVGLVLVGTFLQIVGAWPR